MAYITFDYKCPSCGHTESRMVKREEQDTQYCECSAELPSWHWNLMEKLLAAPRTTFRFADTKLKD